MDAGRTAERIEAELRERVRGLVARELGEEGSEQAEILDRVRVRRLVLEQRREDGTRRRGVAIFRDVRRLWAADLAEASMRDRDLSAGYRDADPYAGVDEALAEIGRGVERRWRSADGELPVRARYVDEEVVRCRVDRVICYVGLGSDTVLNIRMRPSVRTIAGLSLSGGVAVGAITAVLSFWPIGPAAFLAVGGLATGAAVYGGARAAWRRTRPRITAVRLRHS